MATKNKPSGSFLKILVHSVSRLIRFQSIMNRKTPLIINDSKGGHPDFNLVREPFDVYFWKL